MIAAVPAGIHLVTRIQPGPQRTAAIAYASALVLVFATSSVYHLATRTERSRRLMQRLDHSMIYLLIGGTVVAVAIGVLPSSWWLPMIALVVGCAGSGIVVTLLAFDRLRVATYVLYPVTAVAPLGAAAHELVDRLSATQALLLIGGGLSYSVGLPILSRKRPDPWPELFGYHEVFHVATIVAAALHYTVIRDLLA